MNHTIEKIRSANYGSSTKRIQNVMFCLLVKALLPQAQLAIIRFKGNDKIDSPVVLYQNHYWNLQTSHSHEDVNKLNHELGSAIHEVSSSMIISPAYLQSRLDFFEANHVVKMFNSLQRTPTKRPEHVHAQ